MNTFFILTIILSICSIYCFQYKSVVSSRRSPLQLKMGNNAAFGIFSPVVYAAKFVLGEAKLNKVCFLVTIKFNSRTVKFHKLHYINSNII